MAFTYAKDSSDLSRLRQKVGDTDTDRQLFDDAEMNEFLTEASSVNLASALACESLATRFARDYDFTADGASFKRGSISEMYAKQARRLRRLGTGTTSVSVTPKDGYSDDIPTEQANTNNANSFDRSGLVN